MQDLRYELRVATGLVVLLVALNGCGKAEHAASVTHPAPPAVKKAPDATQLALANMVSAVRSGKTFGDIELKFDLRDRPVVGESVDIDLALIPGTELDRVYAVFQAGDGLELTKGGKTPEIAHPAVGVPISHSLTVVPQRDGVFYVSAVVLADSPTDSVTRSFSIPVIAGAGSSAPAVADGSHSGNAAPAAQAH
jgi:hypothetical protein